MRRFNLISSSAVMVALCTLLAGGCGGQPQNGDEQAPTDPQSGGLGSAPGEEQPAPGEEGNGNGNGGGAGKITICHIPPGNPANAHTITVGLPALRAHLKHGDTQGACGSDGGTGGGDVDAGTGGDVDAGTGGGDVDAGTGGGDVDAGTGGGDVDAGPAECAPVGSTCGAGVVCCDGLVCESSGYCEPVIG